MQVHWRSASKVLVGKNACVVCVLVSHKLYDTTKLMLLTLVDIGHGLLDTCSVLEPENHWGKLPVVAVEVFLYTLLLHSCCWRYIFQKRIDHYVHNWHRGALGQRVFGFVLCGP
eukprot:XP_001706207.1 Hypothetical protein GL50803_39098 [Giardia lamblia ATCC 50803]